MRLGELLDRAEFDLHSLVDPDDADAVELRRVFSTDQPLPERYLSGGELVLTGLLFHTGRPDESEAFVRSAVAGGAVAIGAGLDHFGHIPEHLVAACRRAGMPLFSVPATVSFGDITQVFIAAAQDRADHVHAALDRSRKLLLALARGRALDEIAAPVVAGTGIGCQILTAAGKRVVAVGCATTEEQVDEIAAATLTANRFPLAAAGMTILPVGPRRDRIGAWYLALDCAPAAVARDTMEAYAEFAAIATLVRARETDVARLADADGDAALAALADGGVQLGPGTVVVVSGPPSRTAQLGRVIRDALVAVAGVTVGAVGADVVAHLPDSRGGAGARSSAAPGTGTEVADLLRHLRRIAPALDGPVHIGVSDSAPAEGLRGALRAARLAAGLGNGTVDLHTAAELGSAAALLAHVPDEVRAAFVQRILGPVLEHDRRTDADLLETLRVFLSASGSWVRTAEVMHLHPNSVRYRIARVEELTGRRLSVMTDRVDLHLAVELL
jgi:hypothetical protein